MYPNKSPQKRKIQELEFLESYSDGFLGRKEQKCDESSIFCLFVCELLPDPELSNQTWQTGTSSILKALISIRYYDVIT